MDLRNYQKRQSEFILSKINNKGVFDENIALESPTGSGKSYVMFETIKKYFSQHKNKKVVLTTGFNNLVYQLYETALEFDLPCRILIGRNNVNCYKKIEEEGHLNEFYLDNRVDPNKIFTKEKEFISFSDDCIRCENRFKLSCFYNYALKEIEEYNGNLLVITNHSTFLFKEELFSKNFDICFVDECQNFADFYESYLKVEVKPYEFKNIYNYMKKDTIYSSLNSELIILLNRGIKTGNISKEFMLKILQAETSEYFRGKKLTIEEKFEKTSENIIKWINSKEGEDNYIHPLMEDGKFVGINIDYFFDKIPSILPYCIVSATVDQYTRNIFNIKNENFYKENDCKIFDYSKSNILIYPGYNQRMLEKFIILQEGKKHGLFLSTRLDLVSNLLELKNICKYELIQNVDDFDKDKKQILVGSKSLFQGIDLKDIDFVMLNKIPFPRYDSAYRKKMNYIEKISNNGNSFVNYTIPYTTNQLIQCMGRLWRKPEDFGNIALFDDNILYKHRKILNDAMSYREGINLIYKG